MVASLIGRWGQALSDIHLCSVDALLFGIGTKVLPPWDSRTRRNNLSGGLVII